MNEVAAPQRKKRKDFIPYFLGFVIFLFCTVHLISFTATTAQEAHSARVRRALGKKIIIDHMITLGFISDFTYFSFSKCHYW